MPILSLGNQEYTGTENFKLKQIKGLASELSSKQSQFVQIRDNVEYEAGDVVYIERDNLVTLYKVEVGGRKLPSGFSVDNDDLSPYIFTDSTRGSTGFLILFGHSKESIDAIKASIDAINESITSITQSIENTDLAVATKASQDSLDTLETKVTSLSGMIDAKVDSAGVTSILETNNYAKQDSTDIHSGITTLTRTYQAVTATHDFTKFILLDFIIIIGSDRFNFVAFSDAIRRSNSGSPLKVSVGSNVFDMYIDSGILYMKTNASNSRIDNIEAGLRV